MNRETRRYFIIFMVLLVLVLPVSIITYFKAYSVSPVASEASDDSLLTNRYVLQNVMPDGVIDVVIKQAANYLNTQNISFDTLHVVGAPATQSGSFVFAFATQDNAQTLNMNVVVTGSSVLTVTTKINGVEQPDLNSSQN